MTNQAFLDAAIEIAYEAGRLTLGHFQTGVAAEYKADDSPVTVADRAAEALIRQRLHDRFPDHGLVGEEYGVDGDGAAQRWIIDPIDGTKSFLRGVPLYAVLLALEVEGRVDVGVAYFPALGEMVHAARGAGAFLNGRRVAVSQVDRLERGYLAFTDAGGFEAKGRGEAWRRLQAASYHRAGWGDAYGHALVATGRLELMLDPEMNAWDCGPFAVILPEAGGYHGDWSGRETIYGGEALSTSRVLLPEVLALIRGDGAEG